MPETISRPVVWKATLIDLWNTPEKAELVDGGLVRMSPAGGIHSRTAGEIYASLREHARRTGRGTAFADNVGFVVELPRRRSFAPDASYYEGPVGEGFLEGAPRLAVEIRSRDDFGAAAEARLAAKRADYFAAGTLVVWDVDPLRAGAVTVYRAEAPDRGETFRADQFADAEPAVPGWRVRVADLLPPVAERA